MYTPKPYFPPDFTKECFVSAPDVKIGFCPKDAVAPEGYHAMSIYPEYFKISGKWMLAEESRMDCVPVFKGEKVEVVEFRLLKQGDPVILGRTENAEDGIYVRSRTNSRLSDGMSLSATPMILTISTELLKKQR